VSLPAFSAVSVADVMTAITKLLDKSSTTDQLPVPLMKQVASELGPFMCELFNRSVSAGHFPATFKEVFYHTSHQEARPRCRRRWFIPTHFESECDIEAA